MARPGDPSPLLPPPTLPPEGGMTGFELPDFGPEREANEFERSQRLLNVIHKLLLCGLIAVFVVVLIGVGVYAIHVL